MMNKVNGHWKLPVGTMSRFIIYRFIWLQFSSALTLAARISEYLLNISAIFSTR